MSSPASSAVDILQAAGIVHVDAASTTSSIWLARIGKLVDNPHNVVAAFDSGGFNPNTKWLLDEYTFQILVRAGVNDYNAGWAKAKEVKDVLLGLTPQDVNGDRWSGVTMLSDISFLKVDESDRPLFSTNFRVFLEHPENALTNRKPLDYTGP